MKIWTDEQFRPTKVYNNIVLADKVIYFAKVKVTFTLQWTFNMDF